MQKSGFLFQKATFLSFSCRSYSAWSCPVPSPGLTGMLPPDTVIVTLYPMFGLSVDVMLMVVCPLSSKVSNPLSSTVATCVLLDDHVTPFSVVYVGVKIGSNR